MLKKWSLSRIQIDESMAEIPWEWVPGLVIIPADNASPQEPAPIVTDRPSTGGSESGADLVMFEFPIDNSEAIPK